MRIEFWPSTRTERPEIYFTLDLEPDTVDFILNVALSNSYGAVTQFNSTSVDQNCLRYRVRSPAMLSTMCQGNRKAIPELDQVVALLKKGDDLDWEIRIPTDSWVLDKTITLWDEVKEEVPL